MCVAFTRFAKIQAIAVLTSPFIQYQRVDNTITGNTVVFNSVFL